MRRRLALCSLLLPVAIAGCDGGPRQTTAQQAAVAGCRRRADAAYLKQNRALMSERPMTDSPFSSTGVVGVSSAGLGDLYGRDEAISNCVAGLNGAAGSGAAGGTATIDAGTSPSMSPAAPAAGAINQSP